MTYTSNKPKKLSMMEIINRYSKNEDNCIDFFFNIKWPGGFYCEKCGCTHYYALTGRKVFTCASCGHQHYLFSGTIFQDNKLPMFKLIMGLYLFFSGNKGVTAVEMASQLDVNYKTALKLCGKCRALMAMSNSENMLDSMFYEADTVYIGAKTPGHPEKSTE